MSLHRGGQLSQVFGKFTDRRIRADIFKKQLVSFGRFQEWQISDTSWWRLHTIHTAIWLSEGTSIRHYSHLTVQLTTGVHGLCTNKNQRICQSVINQTSCAAEKKGTGSVASDQIINSTSPPLADENPVCTAIYTQTKNSADRHHINTLRRQTAPYCLNRNNIRPMPSPNRQSTSTSGLWRHMPVPHPPSTWHQQVPDKRFPAARSHIAHYYIYSTSIYGKLCQRYKIGHYDATLQTSCLDGRMGSALTTGCQRRGFDTRPWLFYFFFFLSKFFP